MFRKGFFPQGGEGAEGRPWPLPLFGILPLQRAVPELLWQRTSINVCWEWNISQGCLWGTGREGGKAACFGLVKPTFTYQWYLGGACCSLLPPSITAQILQSYFLCSSRGCAGGSEPFLECWQASDNIPAGTAFPCSFLGNTEMPCEERHGGEQEWRQLLWDFFSPLLVLYPPEQ